MFLCEPYMWIIFENTVLKNKSYILTLRKSFKDRKVIHDNNQQLIKGFIVLILHQFGYKKTYTARNNKHKLVGNRTYFKIFRAQLTYFQTRLSYLKYRYL